jgi:hypothetical protein
MIMAMVLALANQVPAADDFGVARLQALLELRQAQVTDAQEWVRIESVLLDQVRREGIVSSPRRIQMHEQATAEVKATLVYREAVRDAAKLALDLATKRKAAGSPEEDVDQARARLDSDIKVAKARLESFDAYVASSRALVDSEKISLDILMKQALTGTIAPVILRRAELRLGLAKAAHTNSVARRELARQSLSAAERARSEYDAGGSTEKLGPAELLRRIERLEDEVMRLEDETEFLRRRLQREIDASLDQFRQTGIPIPSR